MSKEPLFVAVSNQKGGVGKSALTVVLSSYLHFEKNLNVAIIDCDSPQHSLVRMRERDKKAIANSAYFQQLLQQQWNRVPKKAYPIVTRSPVTIHSYGSPFLLNHITQTGSYPSSSGNRISVMQCA